MALAFLLFLIGQQHIINPMATAAAWGLTFLSTTVYGAAEGEYFASLCSCCKNPTEKNPKKVQK